MARETASAEVRPVWQQFMPFVAVAFLLQFVVLAVQPENSDFTQGVYVAAALLMLGGASYIAARWSGRSRPAVTAYLAAAIGAALLGVSGLWAFSIIIPVSIAIRPPTPLAYPVRIGLGTALASLAAMASLGEATLLALLVTGRSVMAPLFGIWLADRITAKAVSGGSGRGPSRIVVGTVTGATAGVLLAVLAAVAYAVAVGISSGAAAGAENIEDFMVVAVTGAGLVGAGLGLIEGVLAVRRSRRKRAAQANRV